MRTPKETRDPVIDSLGIGEGKLGGRFLFDRGHRKRRRNDRVKPSTVFGELEAEALAAPKPKPPSKFHTV